MVAEQKKNMVDKPKIRQSIFVIRNSISSGILFCNFDDAGFVKTLNSRQYVTSSGWKIILFPSM